MAAQARLVSIDAAALDRFAERLASSAERAANDGSSLRVGDSETTVAFVLTFNAVNFGSGWHPHLVKVPGRSGSVTIMTRLRERFRTMGPFTAQELQVLTPRDCASVFGQPFAPPVDALMTLFSRALGDLGTLLVTEYDGSYTALVEAAGGSTESMVDLLLAMPLFRDVATYRGRDVPILKRAQIVPADLARALDGEGWGSFAGLDRLTIFADNLVPHVLRLEGVLVFDPALVRSIEAGELIGAGSEAEVEIRAVAVEAAERLVARLQARGCHLPAWELDHLLWHMGQDARYKAVPRHRARNPYY
ncbi:queuosine salvage family protein [Rhabdothermincola sp.]|uniref:queuosine salvage family protein n=1 Tax=Rhabdothermincola sp. TaxID=2820405 RepID=UPI002FE0AB6F